MRNFASKTGLVALTVVLLAGCGSQPRHYNDRYYNDTRRYDNARENRYSCETCGRVERVERVYVYDRSYDRSSDGAGGAVLGAIIGGVIGSNIGSGDGRRAATAAGAVAGGVIGYQAAQNGSRRDRRNAYRVYISLDDGRWAEVTQLENPRVRAGSHVYIRNDRVYRVS
ncbi:MAG: glycine zipper 2TM domain-containing protein [Steroidobacteraceae bacterium]